MVLRAWWGLFLKPKKKSDHITPGKTRLTVHRPRTLARVEGQNGKHTQRARHTTVAHKNSRKSTPGTAVDTRQQTLVSPTRSGLSGFVTRDPVTEWSPPTTPAGRVSRSRDLSFSPVSRGGFRLQTEPSLHSKRARRLSGPTRPSPTRKSPVTDGGFGPRFTVRWRAPDTTDFNLKGGISVVLVLGTKTTYLRYKPCSPVTECPAETKISLPCSCPANTKISPTCS